MVLLECEPTGDGRKVSREDLFPVLPSDSKGDGHCNCFSPPGFSLAMGILGCGQVAALPGECSQGREEQSDYNL